MSERRGAPIPGSRFVRDYCSGCHEPMRVKPDDLMREAWCSDCEPSQSPGEQWGKRDRRMYYAPEHGRR